ncbi:SigE family RNA polymerase sigma factor [Dactylosporangium vinaceum]|uniref:SigE family RNA polymerase sigma factor n=1 Tax=Dactylosporangium vinaceum TaxID=53362 RepID=A0ABV5M1W8_9ACTN|nr:SigE family RNA polymerase sigma factor [Dactylosporangium vinaceum]UAB99334.1 SigE family RNA polymerase sigma factor [Dactylosporangium vinaceum]
MTFEEFVAARLGALVRYATVVAWDADLAEDIVQNVLVKAHARWGRIQRMEAPERYVQRMLVNEFLSWRRRAAARTVRVGDGMEGLVAPLPDPTGGYDERDAVMRLIGTLPPRQRAVIALRFYADLPVEEIADVLGCRASTVRTHLDRAMGALRVSLPHALTATGEVR